MNLDTPRFAVVGHPNKGKSSIVSTLSHDDSIRISTRSGTTKESSGFSVKSKNSGYELIDTPGFQRPHKVLEWLQSKASSAEQRSKAVADFVADTECKQKFPDEVELLTPLVNGAAILYVVDGSRPYGNEYEAEMEILRWSGQPSMALINPIESGDYIEPWRNALDQYFKIVRVFNPMDAEFEKQIDLLQAFALLKPVWSKQLSNLVDDLRDARKQQRKNSTIILARLIDDLCFHKVSQKVLNEDQAKTIRPLLENRYQSWMKKRELDALQELFANYKHYQTNLSVEDLNLPPDLFDCEQWYMWGLSKTQLATVATITGAAAGAGIDLALFGHSLMLGAIGGGLIGFGSAMFGAEQLVTTKVQGLPLGGLEASIGPIKNRNFPYVVIGRFIYIHQQISQRNHAQRGQIKTESSDLQHMIAGLEKSEQTKLHKACDKLANQKTVDLDDLAEMLDRLL